MRGVRGKKIDADGGWWWMMVMELALSASRRMVKENTKSDICSYT